MISAPLRTPQLKESKPSIKTHGHLALLEWDEIVSPPAAPAGQPLKPIRRTGIDRCYEGGTVVLFIVTIAALAASLCRF